MFENSFSSSYFLSYFLENEILNEQILFYIFNLLLHIEWFPVDYLVLPSSKLAMFKYTW